MLYTTVPCITCGGVSQLLAGQWAVAAHPMSVLPWSSPPSRSQTMIIVSFARTVKPAPTTAPPPNVSPTSATNSRSHHRSRSLEPQGQRSSQTPALGSACGGDGVAVSTIAYSVGRVRLASIAGAVTPRIM